MTELLHQPDARLFDLIDHGALAAAFAAGPMLPGMIGLLPSPYASAAFLLDVNEWLTEYKISLVWANRPLDGRDIFGELHTDFASALPSAGLRRTMYQKR